MKNKEKFAKEILDIVCKCGEVAMDKDTMRLQACDETKCENCYFSEQRYPLNTGSCARNFSHWANSEYKEKKEFSEADKAYVRAMDKLNWFVRDKNGDVVAFVSKPVKSQNCWGSLRYMISIRHGSSATFEPLSWEDEEPTHRNEILGE
ncbi:hypothetical protein [uncultured Coprobacter sp.]|uniref:hypothetical protein n=1 Tax=uncultured Coprobacter sp. TaxID=1720550 RepID=UPI0026180FB9|nr:hypothetical protein [uncultured Coprobacter sp.]